MDISTLATALLDRGVLRGPMLAPATLAGSYCGLAFDLDDLEAGDVWVNLYGNTPLAREHLRQAEQAGAAALISEFPHQTESSIPHFRVTDPRAALSFGAALLHGHPSSKMRVIGITGSAGKSTVACMASRCLAFGDQNHGLISSVGTRIGDQINEAGELTTPDAPFLQRCLGEMVTAGAGIALVEVSSHGIHHQRVADVAFDGALVTNLFLDHRELHPNFSHYIETKSRLFNSLPTDGFAFFSADSPWSRVVVAESPAPEFGIGFAGGADVRVDRKTRSVVLTERFVETLCPATGEFELRLQPSIPGEHNLSNAAAAASIALACGVNPVAIQQAIATFPGLAGRCQTLFAGSVEIIQDMFERPALRTAVPVLATAVKPWEYIVLIAPKGNRCAEEYRETARDFLLHARRSGLALKQIVISRGHVPTDGEFALRDSGLQAIVRTLGDAGLKPSVHDTLESAIAKAIALSAPGNRLLLLGERTSEKPQELVRAGLESVQPRWFSPDQWCAPSPEKQLRRALAR